jgi:hypothetical protein
VVRKSVAAVAVLAVLSFLTGWQFTRARAPRPVHAPGPLAPPPAGAAGRLEQARALRARFLAGDPAASPRRDAFQAALARREGREREAALTAARALALDDRQVRTVQEAVDETLRRRRVIYLEWYRSSNPPADRAARLVAAAGDEKRILTDLLGPRYHDFRVAQLAALKDQEDRLPGPRPGKRASGPG